MLELVEKNVGWVTWRNVIGLIVVVNVGMDNDSAPHLGLSRIRIFFEDV